MAVALLFRPILSCVLLLLLLFPLACPLSESEALLKLKQSFDNAAALDSWAPNSAAPCNWKGLICYNGVVNGLRLEGMGLSGKIDVEALVEMKGLRTLSLKNNSFSGNIPALNRLGSLKAMYLSRNQFSGEIPSDYFQKMTSLKKVWLNDNQFSGGIPSSLVELPNLMELYLENNQLSGTIPAIDRPSLVGLNLSNNKLEGHIPSALSKFKAASFEGNPGLCGEKLGKECSSTSQSSSASTDPDYSIKILTAVVMLAFMVAFVLAVLVLKKKKGEDGKMDQPVKESTPSAAIGVQVSVPVKKEVESTRKASISNSSKKESCKGKGGAGGGAAAGDLIMVSEEKGVFSMQDLMKATAEVLGNGELGSSYKAAMANGFAVVVKRVKEMNALGKEGFDGEIRRLGRLKHPNILTPLAYHYRKDEKLLIYEHIPKGSLLYLLHGDRGESQTQLAWPTRLRIVQGIANGLGYLHKELASHDVPHGNLKSSNVLLGPENQPLLSDYGFSSLLSSNSTQALCAYKTPEAIHHKKVSSKSDIYSFGVIVLEILTGKLTSQYGGNNKGGTDIVHCVKSSIADGRQIQMLDQEISKDTKWVTSMEKLLLLGAACTETDHEQRPDVAHVIREVQEICTNLNEA